MKEEPLYWHNPEYKEIKEEITKSRSKIVCVVYDGDKLEYETLEKNQKNNND